MKSKEIRELTEQLEHQADIIEVLEKLVMNLQKTVAIADLQIAEQQRLIAELMEALE